MRVFFTGGTGLIGNRLISKLLERGDTPVVLTRRPDAARQTLPNRVEVVEGDPGKSGPWTEKLDTCDGVIHLAGENLFNRRWNAAFKQLLVDSRVKTTRTIAEAMMRNPKRADGSPKVLVSTSAIGIYGPRGDEEISEDTAPATDFLANLCVDWEKSARMVETAGIRCALIRVGIVLDKRGGALAKLLPPFKMFVGGPVGSGKQYMAWIHHADLVSMFLFALDNPSVSGPLNGTAPNPVTNSEFSHQLGKALHRPSLVWTPALALRLLLGESAAIVTNGQRVLPKKALSLGFQFQYPHLGAALTQIVSE